MRIVSFFIYVLIVVLLGVLYVSTSRKAMKKISELRGAADVWWGIYKGANGDLSNMAYLGLVDNFRDRDSLQEYKPKKGNNDVVLYLRGDSYSRSVPSSAYAYLSGYYFSNRWQTNFGYRLDSNKKNVLIIETSERFLRENYNDLRIFRYFTDADHMNHAGNGNELANEEDPEPGYAGMFFNRNINQNIEYNLFNYRFISRLFECKAALNYYAFGRASGDVIVSEDNQFLFLRETMEPYGTRSAYNKVPEQEVTLLINNLNTIYRHYLEAGFDEVCFCIIPNPVSLLQPGPAYNRLVQRIQYDPRLQVKYIDLYQLFRYYPEQYYCHGDTHWNNNGKQVWINEVNKILEHMHGQQKGSLSVLMR